MDYSKLSDMEIAQKVWFWWQHKVDHDNSLCGASGAGLLYLKAGVWVLFDPCNNPTDAWPIIVANRIALMPDASEHGAHQWWDAQSSCQTHGIKYQASPLRAAMIVFLMMKEMSDD